MGLLRTLRLRLKASAEMAIHSTVTLQSLRRGRQAALEAWRP